MFISKDKLNWMNRQIGDLQNQVKDQSNSLAALAKYFELSKVVPPAQDSPGIVYEKVCKICKCCPSSPCSKPIPHTSIVPYGVYWNSQYKACECKCHSKNK
jgi:hypothetical protein